ncbi:MAG: hypothetical protein P8184_20950 [Calditrichia bacterium]
MEVSISQTERSIFKTVRSVFYLVRSIPENDGHRFFDRSLFR